MPKDPVKWTCPYCNHACTLREEQDIWYIHRHERETAMQDLIDMAEDKQQQKSQATPADSD